MRCGFTFGSAPTTHPQLINQSRVTLLETDQVNNIKPLRPTTTTTLKGCSSARAHGAFEVPPTRQYRAGLGQNVS